MPKNWKTYKLTDLGTIARGKSKHRPRDAAHLYGGEYPFIQTGDVKAANHRLNTHRQTYTEAGLAQSKLWPKDTMCITIAANIAETAILEYPACFPDSIIGFVANPEISDIDFVDYLMQYFKKQIQSHSIGSVQDNINLATFQRVEFLVPPLLEQRAIASILSALDDKIENNLAMNKTLEDMAMALYKNWFVDFGPFQDGNFIDSELGEIPEGWKLRELGELVKVLGGYAFKGKDFKDVGESVIKIKNISNNLVSIEGSNCIASQVAEKTNPKFQIWPGCFLVAMTGAEVGKVGVVPDYKKRMWLNQRVGMITNPAFKYADVLVGNFLQSTEGYEIIQNLAYGSAQPNISSSGIESISIPIPNDLSILTDELNQLNNWHLQKISNYNENQTLTQLRDTLLPKLISGEVRVKDVEQLVSEAL